MKIIDKRETYKKQGHKRARGAEAIVEGWELNDFVVHLS